MKGLNSGKYEIQIRHKGFATFRKVVEVTKDLKKGIDLHLNKGGIVSGVVYNSFGNPEPYVQVILSNNKNPGIIQYTNSKGSFLFESLSLDSRHSIKASHGKVSSIKTNVPTNTNNLDIKLQKRCKLEIKFIDHKSKKKITSKGFMMIASGIGSGSFGEISSGLMKMDVICGSSLNINFNFGGYRSIKKSFFIPKDKESLFVEVELQKEKVELKATQISGKIMFSEEKGSPHKIRVLLLSSSGDISNRNRNKVEMDGSFKLRSSHGRNYRIIVTHPKYASYVSPSFDLIESTSPPSFNILLQKGGKLTGYIYNNQGRSSGGMIVTLSSSHQNFPQKVLNNYLTFKVTTRPDGAYDFRNIPIGKYIVEVQGKKKNVKILENGESHIVEFFID